MADKKKPTYDQLLKALEAAPKREQVGQPCPVYWNWVRDYLTPALNGTLEVKK